jgi:hypothetical protein
MCKWPWREGERERERERERGEGRERERGRLANTVAVKKAKRVFFSACLENSKSYYHNDHNNSAYSQ